MNVNLTSHFENYIQEQIATGRYANSSEVVRAALRLMEDLEQERTAKLRDLRDAIQEGIDSGEPIPWNADEVKRRGRARLAAEQTEQTAKV